jgi:tellurite resistance protein TehA-like permease
VSVSAFLPIGPLGQGGAAIIQLGVVARDIEFISPQLSQTLFGIGVFVGLIMWSYALLWITLAVATIVARFPRIPFSMAWWGFTFPLGTNSEPHFLLPPSIAEFQGRLHYARHNWERN